MEVNGRCSLPNKEVNLEKRVRILKTRDITEKRKNFWQDGEGKCVEDIAANGIISFFFMAGKGKGRMNISKLARCTWQYFKKYRKDRVFFVVCLLLIEG